MRVGGGFATTQAERGGGDAEVWATNAGCKEGGAVANVSPSEIVVPVADAVDREEGKDNSICHSGSAEDSRMEGGGWGGIAIVAGRSKQPPHMATYSVILIVGEMMVAAAAAQLLLLQLPW